MRAEAPNLSVERMPSPRLRRLAAVAHVPLQGLPRWSSHLRLLISVRSWLQSGVRTAKLQPVMVQNDLRTLMKDARRGSIR
jgi:hypothetical protein